MSDYEMLSLFNDLLNTAFARLNDFLVGLFALLVTGYMAARDLTQRMVNLVLILYTMFSIITIVPALATFNRFALAGALLEEAASRSGSVLPALFPFFPSQKLIMPMMSLLLLGAFVGGFLFFFEARRRDD